MHEVKVGQEYQIVGDWNDPARAYVKVSEVGEDLVWTNPSVYDCEGNDRKKLFFPSFWAFKESGEQLGYFLSKDVDVDVDVEEVRSVSSTGAEKGVKAAQFSLLPMEALTEVAKHYGRGAEKYEKHNMRRGYEWSKSYDALMRHATQFWAGEDLDEETGSHHLTAVVFHALTLLEFKESHPEFDDRYVVKKQ